MLFDERVELAAEIKVWQLADLFDEAITLRV